MARVTCVVRVWSGVGIPDRDEEKDGFKPRERNKFSPNSDKEAGKVPLKAIIIILPVKRPKGFRVPFKEVLELYLISWENQKMEHSYYYFTY